MTFDDVKQHVENEGSLHITAWIGPNPLEWFCGHCGLGWDTLTPTQQATWRAEFGETGDGTPVPWDARWTAQPPLVSHASGESKP